MKADKVLTAKVLEVTIAKERVVFGYGNEVEKVVEDFSSYPVFEFENGLILVQGESCNDWFFVGRDEFEPCGTDRLDSIKETGETKEWKASQLLASVQGSISEFGVEAVPKKHLELWK